MLLSNMEKTIGIAHNYKIRHYTSRLGFLPFGSIDDKGQPTPPDGADFAIRAYGGKCGEIKDDIHELKTLRPKSWHWIKCKINKDVLISRFNMMDYSNSLNTARQNSMGKGELVALYNDYINDVTII